MKLKLSDIFYTIKRFNEGSLLTLFFLLFLLTFNFNSAYGKAPLVLTNNKKILKIDSSVAYGWDPSSGQTHSLKTKYFTNTDPKQSYWYTFKLSNPNNESKTWYMVSYNFTINEIDLYENDPANSIAAIHRDTINLSNRLINHKQPIFIIKLKPNETKQFYLRLKNESAFYYEFAVYTPENFATSFFNEYLAFGLFYGFMAFVLIYNIFYYSILKEKVILFYCLFIIAQIMHMLYRDGTGLFLTPDLTAHSEILKNIGRCAVSIFMLLYTYNYFKTSNNRIVYTIIKVIIIVRLVYAIVMIQDNTLNTFHFELFTLVFCTAFSIYSYKKNNNPDTIYMVIGLSLLTFSYIIYYLSVVAISSLSGFGFFILYYGIAAESIFMTLALAERFKRIKLENISTLQMNAELEQIIKKRTSQIEEKNKLLEVKSEELNLFLYSASHDLKGPLKTIEGLCNLGIADDESDQKKLFELIRKKLYNLESNISDLNSVTKIQNEDTPFVLIDFTELHKQISERYLGDNEIQKDQIYFQNKLSEPFISDAFSIKTIYQNVFENALKYKDVSRKLLLEIKIEDYTDYIKISFKDNGLGIPESILPKIFNMFYRGNYESKDDTGLGLYIVKKAILKIGGTIDVSSQEGIGTVFEIVLPRISM
ncbi:sensor histidine kinase [Cytophaga aurantiaca]|uniref:sensor histidine kinase n=1 Tax=Cytophaga aurantiaca TaxID=29530 RepID=UPI000369C0DA|nr:sensor histidine kinase [Cytophaga aurantiaca]